MFGPPSFKFLRAHNLRFNSVGSAWAMLFLAFSLSHVTLVGTLWLVFNLRPSSFSRAPTKMVLFSKG